jgi:hypothetical protein
MNEEEWAFVGLIMTVFAMGFIFGFVEGKIW